MRLLFVGTHISQINGYSKIMYSILKELSAKHECFLYGIQKSDVNNRKLKNVKIFDALKNESVPEKGFNFSGLQDYIDTVKPDRVIIYNDMLVVSEYMKRISHPDIWVYIDFVYQGMNMELLKIVEEKTAKFVCFSEKWKEYLSKYTSKPVGVLEHGVSDFVKKVDVVEEKAFLCINRNSERKRLDLVIQGFVRLLVKDPSAKLVMITDLKGFYNVENVFLQECSFLKVEPKGFLPIMSNLSDEEINVWYNRCKYGINCSDGEGYGIQALEHSFLGKVQVVTDVGTYRSFLSDENVFVPVPLYSYLQQSFSLGLIKQTATPEMVCEGMLSALSKDSCKALGKKWSEIEIPFGS